MLKKLNIVHIILLCINFAIIPLVGFMRGFDTPETFIAVLVTVLLAHPLLYLIMMLIKAYLIDSYEAQMFMPLCMVLTILLGCLLWYCFFHITFTFANTIALWYGLVLLAFSIPYCVYKVVSYFSEKKNKNQKGPKFIKK